MKRFLAAALPFLLAAVPAFAADISREDLKKALDANPDLLLSALQKLDKIQLFEVIIAAQGEYRVKMEKEEHEKQEKELEAAFKHPYKPTIDKKTRVRGEKGAPITVVEYSDFQCPWCGRAFTVVEDLRKKYGSKMRLVYKHMPMTSLHPEAMPAARWQEAVAMQSPEKAWDFHDKMFQNQEKLNDDFFRATVKELGLDVDKAEKDAKTSAVQAKIDADAQEGEKFGFTGTPGFLVNGVPIRGFVPVEGFDQIIKRLGI